MVYSIFSLVSSLCMLHIMIFWFDLSNTLGTNVLIRLNFLRSFSPCVLVSKLMTILLPSCISYLNAIQCKGDFILHICVFLFLGKAFTTAVRDSAN